MPIEEIDKKLEQHYQSLAQPNEVVQLQLRGAFKEALICTDRRVLILKRGFMTANSFGVGVFQVLCSAIAVVEIHKNLLGGYFEVATAGTQGRDMNFWSQKKGDDPKKAPNCVSVSGKKMEIAFQEAANFISLKQQAKAAPAVIMAAPPVPPPPPSKSIPELLESLAKLRDQGVLSEEEFSSKKADLLARL